MKNFYACDEHIEYVIDDFINLYESNPKLDYCEISNQVCCNYCDNFARYVLKNV